MVQVAARLLAEGDPRALTARRLCTEVGSSTIAVYTRFGSMGGVVRAIVHEGFATLAELLGRVERTGDPVADLAVYGRAYRHVAVTNANLFAVMFAGRSTAGFRLTDKDRRHGRYAMARVVECAGRCVETGRFRVVDPTLCAHHMWFAMHGLATLENGAYVTEPGAGLDACLTSLMVGAGDSTEAATRSVRSSKRRFPSEVLI